MTTTLLESSVAKLKSLTRPARVGLLGAGNRGARCFAPLLAKHPDIYLVALADSNRERLKNAAESIEFGGPLYTSLTDLLSNEDLDGLVITTPDHMHADHVVQALEAGVRHVLVDKPLATTTAGCLKVLAALNRCREKGRPAEVAIGFNMRHKPLIEAIKGVIERGTIGDLMLIENREFYRGGRTYMSRWNRQYALSGGLWIHKGSHDFDVFNWWNAGGNPLRVFASGGLNALRPDKLPFIVEADKPVGPNCTSCAYASECPDYSGPVGGKNLFNAATAEEDGYVQDLCMYLADKDVHDNGIALVEYDNNVRASHLECFVCNFDDRLYTIAGTEGTLMANVQNPTEIQLRPRWGKDRIIDVPPPPEGSHGGADPLLVDNFVASIQGAAPHSAGIRDGIRAVAVGDAAELAWRQKRLVEISELVDLAALDQNLTA